MESEKATRLEIGNKAYQLRDMKERGINVPPSVYLPDELCRRLTKGDGKEQALARKELEEHYLLPFEETYGYPCIVRSSSTNEDAAATSNAGKYLSVYNLCERSEVLSGIKNCWHSKEAGQNMGVIVQKQLSPYYSGVAFIYEENGSVQLLIEAVIGLGELLVSGYVSPLRVRYDLKSGEARVIQESGQRIVEFPIPPGKEYRPTDDILVGGRAFRMIAPGVHTAYACLAYKEDYWKEKEALFLELSKKCERLYSIYGNSDIEWVYTESKELFIVQRRPITKAVLAMPAVSSEAEYGGITIVPGKASGRLVALNEYNGETDCIVFAPTIFPKDFQRLSGCRGMITVECSMLSHSAILAREYQLPYLAGVKKSLYDTFGGSYVTVDFTNRKVTLCEETEIGQEEVAAETELPLDGVVRDIVTWQLLSEEERAKRRLSALAQTILERFYGQEMLKKMMEKKRI